MYWKLETQAGRKGQLSPGRAPGGSKRASLLVASTHTMVSTGWLGMKNADKKAVQEESPGRFRSNERKEELESLERPSGGKGA